MEAKSNESLQEYLKNGQVLCTLINKLKPNSVPRVSKLPGPFKDRERITLYLNACKAYGLRETDLFVTQDLYEGDNLSVVVDNLFSLSGHAQKLGWKGTVIGVKHADANRRNFTQAQLNTSNAVPLLASGSVQVAKETRLDKINKNTALSNQ
jgi:transgelin